MICPTTCLKLPGSVNGSSSKDFIINIGHERHSWHCTTLQAQCAFNIHVHKQLLHSSEHSVVSNLYWGIENVEAAIQAKSPEERTSRLKNSEQMLQSPALLDEHGSTSGIPNQYLICYSYFYLSLVGKLQKDEWQATLHFLQALLVYPWLIRMEISPQLWESLFLSHREMGESSSLAMKSISTAGDDAIDEATRLLARRYKHWLMYHKVMLIGASQRSKRCRVAPIPEDKSQCFVTSLSITSHDQGEKVYPLDDRELVIEEIKDKANSSFGTLKHSTAPQHDANDLLHKLNAIYSGNSMENTEAKCLQDMLEESQSHNESPEGSDSEKKGDNREGYAAIMKTREDNARSKNAYRKSQATSLICGLEPSEVGSSCLVSSRLIGSISDMSLPILDLKCIEGNELFDGNINEKYNIGREEQQDFTLFDHISSHSSKKNSFIKKNQQLKARKTRQDQSGNVDSNEASLAPEQGIQLDIMGIFEKAVSAVRYTEWLGKCESNQAEISTICEMLKKETKAKHYMLVDVMLDQLLQAISTSNEVRIIRAAVLVLSTLVMENRSLIDDMERKGLRLYHLASALKRNVHEAAILIYMINPSPMEIKALELLPALLEVACNSNERLPVSLQLTPPVASLLIIEVFITAFDYNTNNMHLAAISSPAVLSKLVAVARNKNSDEIVALATILVKCMQFDGKCRMFLSQLTPVAPFIHLLRSKEKRSKFIALQFFNEILRIPRTSAVSILNQICESGRINIMHTLMNCIQHLQPEYKVLAANLLLQLDMLEETSGGSIFGDEAMELLLHSISSEESSEAQILSASALSNLGGTYAWTGESYTAAWLVNKAGILSHKQRNMIRNVDWEDKCLEDSHVDAWCSRVARSIIKTGNFLFQALQKGLHSNVKSVSEDCLIAIAWIGCEIAKTKPNNIRYLACEILLSGIQHFLRPGLDLEERLLACLSLYNYASGKGIEKLINYSEGLRDSLRRLSSVTWMAEELLKVTDYFLPAKLHFSCVHTQIIEAGQNCNEAANALIYYKGQLYSGHSDGSIKVWDIKRQTATLVWDVKEHKKAVTCFTLSEPGDSLLSGSTDRTIRVWQMIQKRLECVEVIETKEPIHKIATHGKKILATTPNRGLKVFDASRTVKTICKSKRVTCMEESQGKLYLGCKDSSIQELDITNNQKQEIKASSNRWWTRHKPINSIHVYKDWLYSAGFAVQCSHIKEWRKPSGQQKLIKREKGTYVQAMGVVEDFIYVNFKSSPNVIEIWLRETQRKIGRLSTGSKITSILTANDFILCGTETGLIKGWIPL
ncbi:hypothetical protein Sjap_007468 [Stephania japonica]|uniref:E3 ubiquitin-protein ligase LIN-1 n=1 Tax=Stephania japonica TaxID=461633 RepID=A0AAP0JN22_9MAGN